MSIGEEKLKRAFKEASREHYKNMETPDGDKWTPSAEFKKKTDKLFKKEKKQLWKYINTAGKKAAVFAAAFFVLISATLSVKASRDFLYGFIVDIFDVGTRIEFDLSLYPDAPQFVEEHYGPAYIPEGYELTYSDIDKFTYSLSYTKSGTTSAIDWSQCLLSAATRVNTEGTAVSEIEIGENKGYYFVTKHHVSALLWVDHNYFFTLYATQEISFDELMKIANSVEKAE